jgi:DMSO/TMAO reductase YedYZ molybdopterin-dependent catalytic subunit
MAQGKLPPGQEWIERPIVYDIAAVPPVDLATFRLRLHGAVAQPVDLSWAAIAALPHKRVVRDFHCVTAWSVRSVAWEGVLTSELIKLIRPDAEVRWVLARGRDGYTTSVPYDGFSRPDSLVAVRMNGQVLPPEHGAPLRLVIPSLYAWKSAKYLDAIEFRRDLSRGFWENRGYHDRGDPWLEERFHEGAS